MLFTYRICTNKDTIRSRSTPAVRNTLRGLNANITFTLGVQIVLQVYRKLTKSGVHEIYMGYNIDWVSAVKTITHFLFATRCE